MWREFLSDLMKFVTGQVVAKKENWRKWREKVEYVI